QPLSPGGRDDSVGGGDGVPRPDALHAHRDARHLRTAIHSGSDDRDDERGAEGPLNNFSMTQKEHFMSNVLQRGIAMLALMVASLASITIVHAQMPTSPWKKG